MKSNNDTTANKPSKLLEDLHALVSEAEKLIGNADTAPHPDVLTNLRTRFEASQAHLNELYADTRKQVVAGAKCTDTAIRENPYQSLAIVAGAALIVGFFVGRRST